MHDVQSTLVLAFSLVIFVIFIFLGRASDTFIPMVALPMSLLITFVAMWLLDYSINNLTLMALTLAIGFLVDDAIVFLENVVRRAEAGESIYKATMNSAGEISFTILSMTLSLAAVFIPLVFMPGLLGRIFREFAVTIIVAILASGLVSLTLTPLMCARILKERGPGHKKTWTERFVEGFFIPIRDSYGRTLDWFLDHGWLALPISSPAFSAFGSSSSNCLLLCCRQATAARSAVFSSCRKAPRLISNDSSKNSSIRFCKATPRWISISLSQARPGAARASSPSSFSRTKERANIETVAAQLRKACAGFPAFFPTLNPQPVLQINIGATGSQFGRYCYVISGINPEEVYDAAEKLREKLREYPGFASPPRSDLFRYTPNLDIDIDRDRASVYGVSTTKLQSLLRSAYSQNYVYLIKEPGRPISGYPRSRGQRAHFPQDFRQLYVKSDNGNTMIPIRAVTKAEETLGLQSVNHLNQFTGVTFGFDIKPDVALGDATDYIQKTAAEVLPPSVHGELQGEGFGPAATFPGPALPRHRGALRHVCHPRDSL